MIAALATRPESFADIHHRLGGVPLHRIRAIPAPGTATEEDLLRAGQPICELVDGVLVEKPVGDRESFLASAINARLFAFCEAGKLGVILGEAGYFRLEGKQLRAPDVSFTPWSSFPNHDLPREAYWSVAPALAVEVLSEDNTTAEIGRKIAEFFAAGTRLFWVIDPVARAAQVYTSPAKFKEFDESGTLDGGKVLPGFKLALSDLFSVAEPPKKRPR
jgi:Uma2 family endonuclease